ncbi:FAD-binding protein [Glaciimonas sp. PCH181]|uniref:FAD-dependent oxidoreductase n=1 Tax=Glaciimonas sp. PCH181 TaxID=2133943 RepID=UPI000D33E5F8|nr:FAD-binding protein [Glaciimonas sp. PCH181]PUA19661.1 oxidoreductase [Glaciimonas sp. PCH181]
MGGPSAHNPVSAGGASPLRLDCDVLIIGGGLSAGWAAIGAARAGASVILVDKGYFGTSGVTATAGPGHWWVPPDGDLREQAIQRRHALSGGLADPHWMARIIDQTWRTLPTLAAYYQFPVDDKGVTQYRALRGPEYLRALRNLVQDLGVTILDHSPALELLLHDDGAVAGASGIRRQLNQAWTIRAAAIVMATGGCAFRSHLLGAHTNTGDGYLMAAEAGAQLSGMEFSNYYTVAQAKTTMTRSMSYAFARYFDSDNRELAIAPGPQMNDGLARALLKGAVFCTLDKTPLDIQAQLPQISPNVMLPFVRSGIDPYRDRFEVTLRGEGTVRGSGGLRVIDESCQTSVRGLFAAGDAATRELIAGATSGGGAQNSAWALSSGLWAGQGAAALARKNGRRINTPVKACGEAGLRPLREVARIDSRAVIAAVQREMLPLDKNLFRSGIGLEKSLQALDSIWIEIRNHAHAQPSSNAALAIRESAALTASARWCYRAAQARRESRGMHQRSDTPAQDAQYDYRLLTGGLDKVWTAADPRTHASTQTDMKESVA